MVNYNIFSPDMEDLDGGPAPPPVESATHLIALNNIGGNGLLKDRSHIQRATGSFDYVPRGESQQYRIRINTMHDALAAVSVMLTNEPAESYSPGFVRVARLFEAAGRPLPVDFVNRILEEPQIKRFFPAIFQNPTRGNRASVVNFASRRAVLYDGRAYKNIFGNIRLRHVIVREENNFNTIDYDIDKYCVPSYLKMFLKKKEYKIICEDLEENETPTYPELTVMLDKIGYGLMVYMIDGEVLQETQNKKCIKMLVHNNHFYVLSNKSVFRTVKKIEHVNNDVFESTLQKAKDDNKVSSCYHDEFMLDGIKYKIQYEKELDDFMKSFTGTFTTTNIDFFDKCKIRATRYINHDVKNIDGVDINKCYIEILRNKEYRFPVNTGSEKTEKYNKGDVIDDVSFYYCEFKTMSDIDKAVFINKKCWIMGYLIINLKLDVNIILKHVAQRLAYSEEFTFKNKYNKETGNNESEEEKPGIVSLNYTDLLKVTGMLCIHKKETMKFYNSTDKNELEALKNKYYYSCYDHDEENVKTYDCKYKQKSGLYAYLGIISYSKYQIYRTIETMKKVIGDFEVFKIYTDCINITKKITDKEMIKINKKLIDKYGFSVKHEHSKYIFNMTETEECELKEDKEDVNNLEVDDIDDLMKKGKSFYLTGRAGYGKTYTMKNKIIDYLDSNSKKYVISSSTKKNASMIEGECINTLILRHERETGLLKIKETFKDHTFIVDESSQLTSQVINTLDFLKINANCQIILIGDSNQCTSFDSSFPWCETVAFKRLIDYNFIKVNFSENARYSKEYDEFLNKLIELSYSKKEQNDHIYNFFKSRNGIINNGSDTENYKRLTYSHERGEKFGVKDKDYFTIHGIQGDTIREKHYIYEIFKMPPKVKYTALSRTSDENNIYLVIEPSYKSEYVEHKPKPKSKKIEQEKKINKVHYIQQEYEQIKPIQIVF